MKILIFGAGVIGTTYGWQFAKAGQNVSLLVRDEKKAIYENGIPIHCRDERGKKPQQEQTVFKPKIVTAFSPEDKYDLILVCVKSNQLETALPVLAKNCGKADVLFFQNNWWGDQLIKGYLQPEQYFFGFSRIVGGWRNGNTIECVIFGNSVMSTLLGEANGEVTPRLEKTQALISAAGLRPEVSTDILSWLKYHYVEYIGACGAILRAGSTRAFADRKEAVREAILATREALAVCRARGVPMKAAPFNLKLYSLPLPLLVWIGQKQYQEPNMQSFFEENLRQGFNEIADQYHNVIGEGQRLNAHTPILRGFEPFFLQ
jgi:2-dehydropantoate 2-reductase